MEALQERGVETTIPEFKLVLVGDGGVGKESFVTKHLTGEFATFSTLDRDTRSELEFRSIVVGTSAGPVRFNITMYTKSFSWSSAVRSGAYTGADCAIIMFDVTSRTSYKNVPNIVRDLRHQNEDIPVVLCGNKIEIKDRKVKTKHIIPSIKKKIEYYDISVKKNFNLEKPFVYLARQLLKDDTVDTFSPTEILPELVSLFVRQGTASMTDNHWRLLSILFGPEYDYESYHHNEKYFVAKHLLCVAQTTVADPIERLDHVVAGLMAL